MLLGGGDWAKDNAIYEAWMRSEDKKMVLRIQATRTDSQRGVYALHVAACLRPSSSAEDKHLDLG